MGKINELLFKSSNPHNTFVNPPKNRLSIPYEFADENSMGKGKSPAILANFIYRRRDGGILTTRLWMASSSFVLTGSLMRIWGCLLRGMIGDIKTGHLGTKTGYQEELYFGWVCVMIQFHVHEFKVEFFPKKPYQ